MASKKIATQRRRLADEVYDQLVEAIVSKQIGPDDRLVQEKLASELDISRTPVREALLRLENEGVLTVASSGGFRLVETNEAETLALYEARAAVEARAARLLATVASPAELDRLREYILKEERVNGQDTGAYFHANRNIHRAFVEASSNRFLLEMFDMIWGRAMAFHLFANIPQNQVAASLGGHLALLDAIQTGDPVNASHAFEKHIAEGYDLQTSAASDFSDLPANKNFIHAHWKAAQRQYVTKCECI